MKEEKRLYYFYFVLYLLFVSVIFYLQNRPNLEFRFIPIAKAASSGLGITFLSTILTNEFIWRFKFFRTILGIKIPFIQGRWEGFIRSSYSNHKKKHKIILEITQTLKKTNVWYYDENAFSYSLIADFAVESEGGPTRLYLIYRNLPTKTRSKNLQSHNGVMELSIISDDKEITGIYYNNSYQRETYGEIVLKFKQRKRYKQFKKYEGK